MLCLRIERGISSTATLPPTARESYCKLLWPAGNIHERSCRFPAHHSCDRSCNKCNVMSCDLVSCYAMIVHYQVAAQGIYNLALCSRGICSSVEFCDALLEVNSELRITVSESIPQTNHSKLQSWTLWTCTSSAHPQPLFITIKVYSGTTLLQTQ